MKAFRWLLWIGLGLSGAAFAEPRLRRAGKKMKRSGAANTIGLQMLLRTGRYRVAIESASEQLKKHPDNSELFAVLGVAWARVGYFTDALQAFQFAEGGRFYEDFGVEAHATTIRVQGDGLDALDLRLERLTSGNLPEAREFRLWYQGAADLQAAGDYTGAIEYSQAALGIFPNAPIIHAQIAESHYALGDDLQGDAYLWLSQHLGGGQYALILRIQRALEENNLRLASELSQNFMQFRQPEMRLIASRVETLRRMGELAEARRLGERSRWRLTEDPELMMARARVYDELGETAFRDNLLHRAQAIYPRNRVVQEAVAAFSP